MTYTSANPELNWVAWSLSFECFSLKIRDTEKNLLLISLMIFVRYIQGV